VYQNLEILGAHEPQFVLVLGGDHVYKMDYSGMLAAHVEQGAAITVGGIEVPVADARGLGVMRVDEHGRVREFQEKPADPAAMPGKPDRALASMGIYVFSADHLIETLAADRLRDGSSHDFGKDLLPRAVAAGEKVCVYPFRDLQGDAQGYWRDVGTLDAYWAANLELTQVTPPLDLYDEDWPIWTYQVQAPPAKFVFNEPDRRGLATDSLVSGGCIVAGARVNRSVLFPYVHVDNRSVISDSVVLPEARIGAGCRIRNAVIEARCRVPDGTVIGEDPGQDRARFEISERGIALVTPAMLGQEYRDVL
jgi:glucose-1-phosphate adenylyltransferase